MVLRLLEDVLLTATSQRGASDFLRLTKRHRAGGIQLEWLGVIEARQQIDDVVERANHVLADLVVCQVPAAFFLDQMEYALPRLGVSDVDHPTEDSPVGWRAENRRAENPVEMFVGV